MKKIFITFCVLLCIINGIGWVWLYSDSKISVNDNKVLTSQPEKIIYKDKIVYKESNIDKKILYQTTMFLGLTNDKSTNENYLCFGAGPHTDSDVALLTSPNNVLQDITKFNKDHPNGGN
jgi:hypothetical protein